MTNKIVAASIVSLLTASVCGQTPTASSTIPESTSKPHAVRVAYYVDPLPLHLYLILPPPPDRDSATTKAELRELHRIEASRTPAQIAQAEADDSEEDIFIFKTVLGSGFNAQAYPMTATLSDHVRKDESAASGPLKNVYRRPRPYQIDKTLHPVCALNPEPTSYPSGHSLSGYLLAFTLVQLVPEKREQILNRADEYVHNRLICGVHYASDTTTSRDVAYALFGSLVASPRFQRDLAVAREEIRMKLGLPMTPTDQ